jgi:RNA polymerase sigma-70 factor (ECF subfamily)
MTTLPTTDSIWTRLSADLRRFIRRRVPDDHTADDLLQETFLRIHRSIGSLEQADRLAAWVYRVARNVVHDHHRRLGTAAVGLGDADLAEEPGDRRSRLPESAHVWLDELIRQLPEKYQEAVRLAEVEGLAQQEVADRLGLSLSGAKSRIQRGRAMLKEVLERCCTFEFDRRGRLVDCDPRPERTVCRSCDEDVCQ